MTVDSVMVLFDIARKYDMSGNDVRQLMEIVSGSTGVGNLTAGVGTTVPGHYIMTGPVTGTMSSAFNCGDTATGGIIVSTLDTVSKEAVR